MEVNSNNLHTLTIEQAFDAVWSGAVNWDQIVGLKGRFIKLGEQTPVPPGPLDCKSAKRSSLNLQELSDIMLPNSNCALHREWSASYRTNWNLMRRAWLAKDRGLTWGSSGALQLNSAFQGKSIGFIKQSLGRGNFANSDIGDFSQVLFNLNKPDWYWFELWEHARTGGLGFAGGWGGGVQSLKNAILAPLQTSALVAMLAAQLNALNREDQKRFGVDPSEFIGERTARFAMAAFRQWAVQAGRRWFLEKEFGADGMRQIDAAIAQGVQSMLGGDIARVQAATSPANVANFIENNTDLRRARQEKLDAAANFVRDLAQHQIDVKNWEAHNAQAIANDRPQDVVDIGDLTPPTPPSALFGEGAIANLTQKANQLFAAGNASVTADDVANLIPQPSAADVSSGVKELLLDPSQITKWIGFHYSRLGLIAPMNPFSGKTSEAVSNFSQNTQEAGGSANTDDQSSGGGGSSNTNESGATSVPGDSGNFQDRFDEFNFVPPDQTGAQPVEDDGVLDGVRETLTSPAALWVAGGAIALASGVALAKKTGLFKRLKLPGKVKRG